MPKLLLPRGTDSIAMFIHICQLNLLEIVLEVGCDYHATEFS